MKLMTYNIFDGAPKTFSQILEVFKTEQPDFLAINEANTFNNIKLSQQITSALDLAYYDIAFSHNSNYHVASFSRYPFKKVNKLFMFQNACLEVVVNTPFGEIAINNVHLHPFDEEKALEEIKSVIESQKKYKNRIILGDMNSLSPQDSYNPEIIKSFNEIVTKKFTQSGQFRYKIVSELLKNDYIDCAEQLGKNKINTVPTPFNKDDAHKSRLRLDYIFISRSLSPLLKDYSVVKNNITDFSSDHYPVTAEFI